MEQKKIQEIESPMKSKLSLYSKVSTVDFEDDCESIGGLDHFNQGVIKYQFVIGILKPGQRRIGLIAANKNKISISGKLGIIKMKK